MHRNKIIFPLADQSYRNIKQKMLNWAQQFSIFLFLDSNEYALSHGRYECLLAMGAIQTPENSGDGFLFTNNQGARGQGDWLFGHVNYDAKNLLESRLNTTVPRYLGFPDYYFFCPETVCYLERGADHLVVETYRDATDDLFLYLKQATVAAPDVLPQPIDFTQRVSRDAYLQTIARLKDHIRNGDCYEINYCCEGYAEDVTIHPEHVFQRLNDRSPAPFAAYYKLQHLYMMCASPERFLWKNGSRLISQPIKGTARRMQDATDDAAARSALRNSIKEQAENIMIVDLVRNDLARSCVPGSVSVEELFGIYTFPQVHQMISTVAGTLQDSFTGADAFRLAFPMGSMTGAPKIKVMELIDHYESCARELFSGTVGYISPEGDFDFNVVIRSLFYNERSRYLSYRTGGAITYDSDPSLEWEEMRLKAWALERVFQP